MVWFLYCSNVDNSWVLSVLLKQLQIGGNNFVPNTYQRGWDWRYRAQSWSFFNSKGVFLKHLLLQLWRGSKCVFILTKAFKGLQLQVAPRIYSLILWCWRECLQHLLEEMFVTGVDRGPCLDRQKAFVQHLHTVYDRLWNAHQVGILNALRMVEKWTKRKILPSNIH